MPTPPKKHRTYCKSCKDFTIHSRGLFEKDLSCTNCDTIETGYIISEVDPQLIKQQRARYKKSRQQKLGGLYNSFLMGVGLQAMMELEEVLVIECDAGQNRIDEKLKQIRLKQIEEYRKIKEDYKLNYGSLGRNDKCSCGSGKKFKKCHLVIFRKQGIN